MKNQILKMCAILGIAGMLAGCGTTVGGNGDSKEALNINVTDMANELKNGLNVLKNSLSELDTNVALTYYGIDADKVKNSVVVVSTGATAEEIAVFEAADESSADAVKSACEDRKAKQTTSYADYKPSETSRLDKAIIKEDGNYVVYCVTDDTDKANEIIDKYFK